MKRLLLLLLLLLITSCAAPPTPSPLPTAAYDEPPAWFSDAVVYEVYVRSFADSNGDGVGDLDGIRQKLDYLESLNVKVLWLMPIYPSPSVHGYDVTDFFGINPEYGTTEDLIELVEAVHQRGMHIILDFVPSHLSAAHPMFVEALANPDSEHADWFVWTNETHTSYAGFADSKDMPRFNHYNQEVVDYLVEAARFWLDLNQDGNYLDGVDGFRVDNITFPPEEFFIALREGVKSVRPDALLLGEAWLHSASDMSRFYPDKFDALFDFPLYELFQGNPGFSGDGVLAGKSFPNLLWTVFEEQNKRFPAHALVVRFLSNHDTNRILSELNGDIERARLVPILLATLPGPVMIYYGEEIGMLGKKGTAPHWDSYRREPMQWWADSEGEGQTTWFEVEDAWNQPNDGLSVEEQETDPTSLLHTYRRLLLLRSTHPALRSSAFKPLELETSGTGTWGFIRGAGEDQLVVLLNFATEPRIISMTHLFEGTSSLRELISGQSFATDEGGGGFTIEMAPAQALVLEAVAVE